MELIEIKDLFYIDNGAPAPTVISNDNELIIIFYSANRNLLSDIQERNTIYDEGVVVLKFKVYLKYSFGIPSNETLQGHPYYQLGMRSYAFYEVKNSNLIEDIDHIQKIHPYYDPLKLKDYKHYLLTFHDSMFECVAKDFEVENIHTSMYKQATVILNELSKEQF